MHDILVKLFFSRLFPISMSEQNSLTQKIVEDSNFGGVIVLPKVVALHMNQQNSKKLIICKEHFSATPIGIYSTKEFFLLDQINKIIANLNSGGIIEFWFSQHVKSNVETIEKNSSKVLLLKHFEGAFSVLFLGVILSCVVFVLESVKIKLKGVFFKGKFHSQLI